MKTRPEIIWAEATDKLYYYYNKANSLKTYIICEDGIYQPNKIDGWLIKIRKGYNHCENSLSSYYLDRNGSQNIIDFNICGFLVVKKLNKK